jgi:hypothetical protein
VLLAWASLLAVAAVAAGRGGAPRAGGLVKLHEWPEDGANLVANAGFEEVDASGAPVGWRLTDRSALSVSGEAARTGTRSLLLDDAASRRRPPLAMQKLDAEAGWYAAKAWIMARGAEGKDAKAGGRLGVWLGKPGPGTRVVRGTTEWTPVEVPLFPVKQGDALSVRLEGFRRPPGQLFFDDLAVYRLTPPAVDGFLLYPNYRGVLFADRPEPLRVWVTLDRSRVSESSTVRLSLMPESGGAAVATADAPARDTAFAMGLAVKDLPTGAYTLKLEAIAGGARHEGPAYRVVKVEAGARSAFGTWVDPDNVLVLGGRRRFVLGIYDTSGYSDSPGAYEARIGEIGRAPFDLYINYWLGGAPISSLKALTSVLQRHRMSYLHSVGSWYPEHKHWPKVTECGGRRADALGRDEFTTCMASALAEDRGFAGWYTVDERPAVEVPRAFAQYRVLKDAVPGGVTFIAQNRPRELARWRDATDVIGVDPYPIYNIPEGSPSPLEQVTSWVEDARTAVHDSRPVWAVIQFFPFGSRGHWPTYDELRTMSYMAVVAGAKGLFYWSYGAKGLAWVKDRQLRSQLQERLQRVTVPEVRVLAKRVDRERFVVAVNHSGTEHRAVFALAEPPGRIEVVGEGRTVSAERGAAYADSFAPYATHVYRIAPAGAQGPS